MLLPEPYRGFSSSPPGEPVFGRDSNNGPATLNGGIQLDLTRKYVLRLFQRLTGKFFYLFTFLILLLVLYPYVGEGDAGKLFILALYIAIPISGIYAVSFSRPGLFIASFLAIPLVMSGIDLTFETHIISSIIGHISGVVFYAFSSIVILVHIIRERRIQADTLYGAVCVYLMLGLTWFMVYRLAEHVSPGSFYCGDAQNIDGIIDGTDLRYYSFVTLTTLGYGDITPITAQVRSAAFLEAATGTLFTTILIARLVGLYTAQFQADREVKKVALKNNGEKENEDERGG